MALTSAIIDKGSLKSRFGAPHRTSHTDQLAGCAATVTSTSGPPDGRSTGYLASHTSGGTMRCLDSRLIDERMRWATSTTGRLVA